MLRILGLEGSPTARLVVGVALIALGVWRHAAIAEVVGAACWWLPLLALSELPAPRSRGQPGARGGVMRAITVEHLSKRYGEQDALRDVSFEVLAGQVVALLGPNGAGKTTTMEILEGYQQPSGGTARVLGSAPRHAGRAWRARIGLVLQSTSLDAQLTVREALGVYARLFPRPRQVGEVLDLTGLTGEAGTRIGQLSGGQRRRVDVGLGIIGRPELLFLDEPTTGLDPAARRQA